MEASRGKFLFSMNDRKKGLLMNFISIISVHVFLPDDQKLWANFAQFGTGRIADTMHTLLLFSKPVCFYVNFVFMSK